MPSFRRRNSVLFSTVKQRSVAMLVVCAVILNALLLQGVKAKGESALGK